MSAPCESGPRHPRRVSPPSSPGRASPPPRLLADERSSSLLSPAPPPRGRGQELRLLPADSARRAGRNRTDSPPPTSIEVLGVRLLLEPTRLLRLAARLAGRDAHPARHPLPDQQQLGSGNGECPSRLDAAEVPHESCASVGGSRRGGCPGVRLRASGAPSILLLGVRVEASSFTLEPNLGCRDASAGSISRPSQVTGPASFVSAAGRGFRLVRKLSIQGPWTFAQRWRAWLLRT